MKATKYDEICHLMRNGLLDIGWLCRKVVRVDIPYKDQYAMFAFHRAEQIMESLWKLREGQDMDEETKALTSKLIKEKILMEYHRRRLEISRRKCKIFKKKLEDRK